MVKKAPIGITRTLLEGVVEFVVFWKLFNLRTGHTIACAGAMYS